MLKTFHEVHLYVIYCCHHVEILDDETRFFTCEFIHDHVRNDFKNTDVSLTIKFKIMCSLCENLSMSSDVVLHCHSITKYPSWLQAVKSDVLNAVQIDMIEKDLPFKQRER